MATQRKDTLTKPDMVAVLSRTHLARDIHGFLLPLFEAISNAMDGIENRFDAAAGEKGRIAIHFSDPNDPAKIKIRVTDNGSGLDENNYNSFKTPFSGYKLREKGRGFGRFIAFKVFRGIVYSTRYEATSTSSVRNFRFDIHEQEEFDFLDGEPAFEGTGLQVEYDQPAEEWHDLVLKLVQRDVMEEIGGHFLPYFLYRWLPEITITFGDGEPEDITAYFKSRFVQLETDTFTCEIDGSTATLTYALSRIERSKRFRNHCLLFSAADRIVGSPRDLTTKLGGPFFVDGNDRKYVVIAVVRGEAFESRLNDSRTSIDISPATIEDIVSTVSDIIQAKETDQIRKIKEGQSSDLTEALRENPILRLGLRGKPIDEYVAKKPNHWRAEQFISDLAVERFRASADLTRQITAAASNAEDYENKIKELVAKVDEGKKEALAEYVIHRKNIIELMESARRYQADGRRAQEDHVHELVFRRFSDSVKTSYFEHNLWLIDDALAFVPYVSSDRAMHGHGRKAGDKVTDLLFFDDSMILGDRDGTTLSIVEFKKPMRDDYRFGDVKHDPVLQVVETLEKATEAGGIVRMDGGQVSFTGVTRRFAFIIADLRPTLVKVLKRHDFVNDWHPNIFVRYRGNESVFIQAFGYDTLIENAKKRNQAFFSVLLDE